MNLQDGVNISESLIITAFSMGIVFITLIIISLILEGFRLVFYKEDDKKPPIIKQYPDKEIKSDGKKDEPTEEEIIAIISALIIEQANHSFKKIDNENLAAVIASAITAKNGNGIENLNIKSIKKIKEV